MDATIALFMVAGLAVCMFIQLKFLNNGLRLFDVLFVLPIYQVRFDCCGLPHVILASF